MTLLHAIFGVLVTSINIGHRIHKSAFSINENLKVMKTQGTPHILFFNFLFYQRSNIHEWQRQRQVSQKVHFIVCIFFSQFLSFPRHICFLTQTSREMVEIVHNFRSVTDNSLINSYTKIRWDLQNVIRLTQSNSSGKIKKIIEKGNETT